MKTIGFPRFGIYTTIIVDTFRELGFTVLMPPPITKKTIELGVKYSPGEICFPFKVTLGTMMELLERKVDVIAQIGTKGWCVLRCYACVQEQILKDLGYKFEMINFNVYEPVKTYRALKKINPQLNIFRIVFTLIRGFKKIRETDLREKEINKNSDIRIGIIGEIHTCDEPAVNLHTIEKMQKMGCYVEKWIGLWGNIKCYFRNVFKLKNAGMRIYRKKAKQYFPEKTGGHANENLVRLIKYAETGFDGIVCLRPLYCNPEGIMEYAFEQVSRDYNIPLLLVSIDEAISETHLQTRIESFVDMLKMKKEKEAGIVWKR